MNPDEFLMNFVQLSNGIIIKHIYNGCRGE